MAWAIDACLQMGKCLVSKQLEGSPDAGTMQVIGLT